MSSSTAGTPRPLSLELRERALTALQASDAPTFLARLAYWLALGARVDYAEAGIEAREAYGRLRAHNERLIVVGGQLRKLGGEAGFGYPPDAFLDALSGKPGGNPAAVEQAITNALGKE